MLTSRQRRLENRVADWRLQNGAKRGWRSSWRCERKRASPWKDVDSPPDTPPPQVEIGDWRSEMKIGERASLLYERAAMELPSLVSGMTEFAANLYPLRPRRSSWRS